MKEIKFKAYDSETEEWYYSDHEYDDHFFEFKDGTLKCFGVSENPETLHEPPYPESYECEDVLQYLGHENSEFKPWTDNERRTARIFLIIGVICGFGIGYCLGLILERLF